MADEALSDELDRVAVFMTSSGAITVGAAALGIAITGYEITSLPGILLGFVGAVCGRALVGRQRTTGMAVMLYAAAGGAWLGCVGAPSAASAITAALVYLLLACFAAVMLTSRQLVVYGTICTLATASLVAWVDVRGGAVALYPGGAMAVLFVPTGFLALGQIARLVRSTMRQLAAAEAEARHALDARGRFLANMSHELRTPLNAIIGYSEMLMEDLADRPEALADLGHVRRSGRTLLGHIDALLDLAKLEAGHLDVYVEPVDLNLLVHGLVAELRPAAASRGNELVVELGSNVVIATDRQKLGQVLTNLLSNAVKFTEHGTVTVCTEVADDTVTLTVRDTGIGMAPAVLETIWQPFMQADESTTRVYGGTGLGLTLVREFSELLGGGVAVDSELGVGTCFRVWLPRDRAVG